jgi:ABC-type multidrug transport system ATPase subunit
MSDHVLHRNQRQLLSVASILTGSPSAGMKRRLSVAIALIGSPSVVYLDEPSTGLDPASRNQLWKLLLQEKRGKALVLTTHSMQEAEVLCDRLGILIDGRLACIGAPKELAARLGGYAVRPYCHAAHDCCKSLLL